jgi:uncharacterized membrane protein
MVTFITILGALSSTVIFGGLFKWMESLILKNSLLRMVYSSVKDLFDAFVGIRRNLTSRYWWLWKGMEEYIAWALSPKKI